MNTLARISREFLEKHKVYKYAMKKIEDMSDDECIQKCHWYCEENNLTHEFMKFREARSRVIVYIHGKGGSAEEAEHYKTLFPDFPVFGLDYKGSTPWDTKDEIEKAFISLSQDYGSVIIIANSIGAYFTMNALHNRYGCKALFISPVVDMEKLITDMMIWSGVTERDLYEQGEIPTNFGETLSWDYLQYVRQNPVEWNIPTAVLYGENDSLVSKKTVEAFCRKENRSLTVMPRGEHWFHTEEQMNFLDCWAKEQFKK